MLICLHLYLCYLFLVDVWYNIQLCIIFVCIDVFFICIFHVFYAFYIYEDILFMLVFK